MFSSLYMISPLLLLRTGLEPRRKPAIAEGGVRRQPRKNRMAMRRRKEEEVAAACVVLLLMGLLLLVDDEGINGLVGVCALGYLPCKWEKIDIGQTNQ